MDNQLNNRRIVWSLTYTLLSMLLGYTATRFFNLPSWTTPALCFNNTTSLPLLLVQALDATGILTKLLMSDSDTSSDAVARAKSYFLVCAIVGNSLTFALGPRLLDGEEAPDKEEEDSDQADEAEGANGGVEGTEDVEQGRIQPTKHQNGDAGHADGETVNEETSLLPDPVVRHGENAGRKGYRKGKKYWDKLPPWAQTLLDYVYAFCNAPLIGAIIGVVIGLTPPLHRAFFNDEQEGGFFKAWLTSSVQNIGDLFAALQIVVVGVKLSDSLRKMKRGEESGKVPWIPMIFVLVVRFVIWPV